MNYIKLLPWHVSDWSVAFSLCGCHVVSEVLELTFKPRRPAWDVPGVAGEQPWWSRYAEVLSADLRGLALQKCHADAMAAMAAMIDSYRFYRYCSFLQIEMKMFALWVCHFEDSSVQSLLGFVLFVPLAPRISSCRPSCDVAWCSYLSGRCRMCKAPGEVGVLRPS